jgi:hypothetical protein
VKPTTIAVDVATDSLEVAVSGRAGRVTERHRLSRGRVLPFFRKQEKATVLLEAFRNEDIHPVPLKSPDQQALAAIHRLRSSWIPTRTARLNTLRGYSSRIRSPSAPAFTRHAS